MVFTGLVQATGKAYRSSNCQLRVNSPGFFSDCKLGDSISVNGVCLTLVEGWSVDNGLFFVMEETRGKTNLFLGEKDTFDVNLEKSLSHGNPVGGHYVLGHVHGLGIITSIKPKDDGSQDIWVSLSQIPKEIWKMTYKGSIAVDGTSLTVAEISENSFRISIIPHTLTHTIFQFRKSGDYVNIEFDQSDSQKPKEIVYYTDEDFMLEAIKEGQKGRCTSPPNPWVGCVLSKNGKIIGIGYHDKAGNPHAEIVALRDAEAKGNGNEIKGCTVYVTLEPCHHFGRTPPCDLELIRRGVSRVVVAVIDIDLRTNGEGIKLLQQNGIQVTEGICQKEAEKSLKPYLHHRKTGRPFVVIKTALSLDGHIACEDGTSQWITGPVARKHVHELRAQCQAIIVGSGTVLTDDPQLTVRDVGIDVKPLRVVLDSRGRVLKGNILDLKQAPTLIFTTDKAPPSSHEIWKKAGIEIKVVSGGEKINFLEVLEELGKRGILQVMVEGGACLQSYILSQHLANSLSFYYGPCLIGSSGKKWAQEVFSNTIEKVKFWNLDNVVKLENDIYMEYSQ